MSTNRTGTSGSGDWAYTRIYETLKEQPVTFSTTVIQVNPTTCIEERQPDLTPPTNTAENTPLRNRDCLQRPDISGARFVRSQRNLESGDNAESHDESRSSSNTLTGNADDGSITIHSLSSNKMIVVPETHRNPPDAVPLQQNNFVRPRTALVSSRPCTANTEHGTIDRGLSRPMTRGSEIPSTAGTRDSRYAVVRPVISGVSRRSLTDPLDLLRQCSRPYTASSEVVQRGHSSVDDERDEKLRSLFQIKSEEPSYNEWREGMEDPTEESWTLKESSESLYFKAVQETDSESSDAKVYTYKVLFGRIVDLLDDFALLPTPPGFSLKCRLTRDTEGMEKGFFPEFILHLQRKNEPEVLLLIARREKTLATKYVISTNPAHLSRRSSRCVAILEGNLRGSVFKLRTPVKNDFIEINTSRSGVSNASGRSARNRKVHKEWEQILSIAYEPNPLGFKGPRRIVCKLPKLKSDYQRCCAGSFDEKSNQFLVSLRNKDPLWNHDTNSFVLNFRGRVDVASAKNFQISHPDLDDHMLLQFGRCRKDDSFILDFGYPFCPLQAFALALSVFDKKWGLE